MPAKTRILVIRLSAMGDVAMTVPVLLALTQKYPNIEVVMLSQKRYQPLFHTIPNVIFKPANIKAEHKGIFGLYRLYKELRSLQITHICDLHDSLRSNVLKRFFGATISFKQLDKKRKARKLLTRAHNKIFKPIEPVVKRYADVFTRTGFPVEFATQHFLTKRDIPKALSNNSHTQKWIGYAPQAAHISKSYPEELSHQLLERLRVHNIHVFLFGGPDESTLFQSWSLKYSFVTNVAGRLSFDEELALISNLDAMISMDSGNGHLAALYQVPTITVWGTTHPYAGFQPVGQPVENQLLASREQYPLIPTSIYGNKEPNGYDKAIETVTPEMIVTRLKEIIK